MKIGMHYMVWSAVCLNLMATMVIALMGERQGLKHLPSLIRKQAEDTDSFHLVKRTSSSSSESQTALLSTQDKVSEATTSGTSQRPDPSPLFQDDRRRLRLPQLFEAMKNIISKHKEELPASRYKYEAIPGQKGKILVRVDGTEESFEVDVDPDKLLEPMRKPRANCGDGELSRYKIEKLRAESKGQLQSFIQNRRDKVNQRYQKLKDEGKPSHSYHHFVANLRRIARQNKDPLVAEQQLEKKKKDDQERKREASLIWKTTGEQRNAEEILARKRILSRRSSAKHYAKTKMAKLMSMSIHIGEPSHANQILNSSEPPLGQSINSEAPAMPGRLREASQEVIDLTRDAEKGKMKMIDLNKSQKSIDLNESPGKDSESESTTISSD